MTKNYFKISNWIPYLLAALITGIYYFFTSLNGIKPFDAANQFMVIKAIGLQCLLLIIFFSAAFYIAYEICTVKIDKTIIFAISFIASFFLNATYLGYYLKIETYKYLGDYLRDHQGINWYYMDYSGWGATFGIFSTFIMAALFYFILTNIIIKTIPYLKSILQSHYAK